MILVTAEPPAEWTIASGRERLPAERRLLRLARSVTRGGHKGLNLSHVPANSRAAQLYGRRPARGVAEVKRLAALSREEYAVERKTAAAGLAKLKFGTVRRDFESCLGEAQSVTNNWNWSKRGRRPG
jgi:hypothetical protein